MRQDAFELDRSMPRHYPAESTNPAFMPASVDHGIPGTISPYGMRGLSLDEYGCGPMSFDTAGRSAELWATRPKVSAEIQQQLSAAAKSLDNQGFEDETCTHLLAGETFVPCSLVEYEGRRAAIFVFSVRTSLLMVLAQRMTHALWSALQTNRTSPLSKKVGS